MIEIKDLLLKFDSLLLSEEVKKESIVKVISEIIGIKISSKEIRTKGDTIYLDIRPVYKSEIFIKKNIIASKLQEVLGSKTPKNIR